jgi:hypothetical protein
VSDYETSAGRGWLLGGQRRVPTRYTLYRDPSGRPVLIELWDRPSGMFSDETVQVVLSDGRQLSCTVLDNTPMCPVIDTPTTHHKAADPTDPSG